MVSHEREIVVWNNGRERSCINLHLTRGRVDDIWDEEEESVCKCRPTSAGVNNSQSS